MRQFKIITAEDSSIFEVDVNKALQDGWELYGDTMFAMAHSMDQTGELRVTREYCQAFVKRHGGGKFGT